MAMALAGVTPAPGPAEGLRTDYPFVLPRGYADRRGHLHRDGVMRLATARDEIAPQSDSRVRTNPAYLTVLLLSRTVLRIGDVSPVDPEVIEDLFASDLAFLQDLYRQVNLHGHTETDVACPGCGHRFGVSLAGGAPGEF